MRDGGDRQWAGAGLTALRQRSDRCAAAREAAHQAAAQQRRMPLSTPAPGCGPPARPLAPLRWSAPAPRARPRRSPSRERSSGLIRGGGPHAVRRSDCLWPARCGPPRGFPC